MHIKKMKGSARGLENHNRRKEGKEHTYQHADPSKKNLNKFFRLNEYCKLPIPDAIQKRIDDGYTKNAKIRSNQITHLTHILTGSHETMNEIFKDEKLSEKWINQNIKFLQKEYGKENIVAFDLHLDERTPHIHAVTVPLTKDGRLSARDVVGNKTKMKKRQDNYAEMMKEFGLKRGISKTGIKHEDAQEYYARINEVPEQLEQSNAINKWLEDKLNLSSPIKREEYKKLIKNAINQKNEIEKELQRKDKKLQKVAQDYQDLEDEMKQMIENPELFEEKVRLKNWAEKYDNTLDLLSRLTNSLLKYEDIFKRNLLKKHEENPKESVDELVKDVVRTTSIKGEKVDEEIYNNYFDGLLDENRSEIRHNFIQLETMASIFLMQERRRKEREKAMKSRKKQDAKITETEKPTRKRLKR